MGEDAKIIVFVIMGSLSTIIMVLVVITLAVLYNRKIIEKDNSLRMTIKNQELELLRNSITAQEDEREVIARNLHDEIGPLLTTHKLNLNSIIFDLEDGELTVDQLKKEQKFVDRIIDNIRTASYDLTPAAQKNLRGRRSLYVAKPIKSGEFLTTDHIKSVRPSFGLHPKYLTDIIGKKVTRSLDVGDRLSFSVIETE